VSDFITNGSSVLPVVKTDARQPSGATTEWTAEDSNNIRQALLDTRSYALGFQTGFVNPNSALVAASGSPSSRALQDRFADVVNVKDFGAVGNGVVDDTAAIAAAAAYAPVGSHLFFPQGTYLVSYGITFTQPIIGLFGPAKIVTASSFQTGNVFTFTGGNTLGVHGGGQTTSYKLFYDLTFDNYTTSARGSGAYIYVNPGGGLVAENTHIFNCSFNYGAVCVDLEASNIDIVKNCSFFEFKTAGLIINNNVNPDAGDSCVTNNYFTSYTGVATAPGILQYASGGLKITANKFNVLGYGYKMSLTGNTSDLLIVGNSFENATNSNILFYQSGSSYSFTNVVISGNQIALSPIGIDTTSTYGWLTNISVSDNVVTTNTGLAGNGPVVYFDNVHGAPNSVTVASPYAIVDILGVGVPTLSVGDGSIWRRADPTQPGPNTPLYVRGSGVWWPIGDTGTNWSSPTFLNSWVDYGNPNSPTQYRKDRAGNVHLRFNVKNGSGASTAILQVPAGYRPNGNTYFGGASYDGSSFHAAAFYVDSTGTLYCIAGAYTNDLSGYFVYLGEV